MKKSVAILIFICLTSVILTSCTTKQKLPTKAARNQAKFDFVPPAKDVAGSANMSIAIVKPVFVSNVAEYLESPFPEMAVNMGNDFEELLAAKGFTMRGPFNSKDEMVFNDKVNSSFILEISIDLAPLYTINYAVTQVGVGASLLFGGSPISQFTTGGTVTFGGNLVLTASSPQYGEKIWKKNIALEKSTFTFIGSEKWNSRPNMADLLKQDNLVYNTIVAELDKIYNKSLDLVWRQIDPNEMKIVTEQAKKADKKGN